MDLEAQKLDVEVLIIGAGPAGSMTAIELLRQGRDCLLIDRVKFPRKKLCGGLLTETGIRELERIFKKNVDPLLFYPRKIAFYSGFSRKEKLMEYRSEAQYALVDRESFDDYLVKQYLSLGGKFWEGESIVCLDQSAQLAYTQKGKKIHYQYMIGADGVSSFVRRQLNPSKMVPAFCREVVLPKEVIPKAKGVNVFFEKGTRGFGWVFEGQEKIMIGVGELFKGEVCDKKTIVGKKIEEIIGKNVGDVKMDSWVVPYGDMPKVRCTNRIFLIGDAAGYVDPILGEGLSYALTAGRKIAATLNAPDKKKEYHRQFNQEKKLVFWGKIYQRIFFSACVQTFFFRIVRKRPQRIAELCDALVLKKSLSYQNIRGILKKILA